MARIRQLSKLYLRGSLANETMANLTDSQRHKVDQISRLIADHEVLQGHRREFIFQLGATIAGDYSDARNAAEQEYQIAIWRGVVHLLYHANYTYVCRSCEASCYTTQRGTQKAIDRRHPVCPHCHSLAIMNPGGTGFKPGQFIHADTYEEAMESCRKTKAPLPTCCSPISPVRGAPKVENPDQMLLDPTQISKFFGEFIWNYFRQVLLENKIVKHGMSEVPVYGPADLVAVEAIISLLKQYDVKYVYCPHTCRHDGYYHIETPVHQTSPEVSASFCDLLKEFAAHGVHIQYNNSSIKVPDLPASSCIEVIVKKSEQVTVLAKTTDNSNTLVDVVELTAEAPEDDMGLSDTLSLIRAELPNGPASRLFDIYIQYGSEWDNFTKSSGQTDKPKQETIAGYLGINNKAYRDAVKEIKLRVLAHVIGPNFQGGPITRREYNHCLRNLAGV